MSMIMVGPNGPEPRPKMPRRYGRAMHRAVRRRLDAAWIDRNIVEELPVRWGRPLAVDEIERMVELIRRA
jgi:hypothetical protein